jgi:hypothetical protein
VPPPPDDPPGTFFFGKILGIPKFLHCRVLLIVFSV